MQLPTFESEHYVLDDAEELHQSNPETFWIPKKSDRQSLSTGDLVKLIFRMEESAGSPKISVERMWVEVTESNGDHYVGRLDNDPYSSDCLKSDMIITFKAEHIIDIYNKE